ncbi:hypothetical protein K7A41_08155 [Sphingobacterium sp. InxBP1]|uniref:hypothetical protein n=1 Tax=Sphingobacterium sp. InxBP1 TaxID=2870328 RepID=UPI002242F390|nr:hypothetical protein [Sphingobacterium sp. InxBP1]MCW8311193.1 hypothetical protein [Sphingobacterium sp. InxBP1]
MKEFIINCEIDGIPQQIVLGELYGGRRYHVYINKRFVTSVVLRHGDWVMLCNNPSWLTTDELTIFVEYINGIYSD